MNKNLRNFLLFVSLAILSFAVSSCGVVWGYYESKQYHNTPHHLLEANDEYKVIWDLSDIHVTDNNVVNASGKIIVEGVKKGKLLPAVFGLDSASGNTVWQIQNGSAGDNMITYNNILYRGTSGTAEVQAYNVENGKLLWHTLLPWGHSVSALYSTENKIFVYTNNDLFFILNERGEILETIHTTDPMFLETNGILYMGGPFSIKAIDRASKHELWRTQLDDAINPAPIFENGTIFLGVATVPKSIYSIDQSSGKVNWKVPQDISSNMFILGDKIYFISYRDGGYLVVIDRYGGNEISKVRFSPPFDLYNNTYGYIISGDPTNNVLTISFGDNTQILGLKLVNP